MKNSIFILTFIISFLFSCKKEKVLPDVAHSYDTYSLLNLKEIKSIPGVASFTPYSSCMSNGKIYVANYDGNRIEIINSKTGTGIGFINFPLPTDVCVDSGRIYATTFGNRLTVYDETSLDSIASIRTVDESGFSRRPYGVKVFGDKVFIRTSTSFISVYKKNDVLVSNGASLRPAAFLKSFLTVASASYSMEGFGNKLYAADRNANQVNVYDVNSIDVTGAHNTAGTAINPVSIIKTNASPSGVACNDSCLFISYSNAPMIDMLDLKTSTTISSFAFVGFTKLKVPERIFIKNDTLLISDQTNSTLTISAVNRNKGVIEEYKK